MPYGTRAPKELLHHLPALILRRLSVSADSTEMLSGLLGSRLLDRRPPHYRCPAVPGFNASARAILMALGSSVLPSGINHLLSGDCVLLVMRTAQRPATAPLFGSQPRRPSCVCSGLEPHCRTSRCARPQPTPSPRYCSLTSSLLGTANCNYEYCPAVLLTAAPDHCGPPGPVVSPVAVLQQPWLRNSTTAPSCELQLRVLLPAVRVCQALPPLWGTRETITTPPPNVYSGQHRFPRARQRDNRPHAAEGTGSRPCPPGWQAAGGAQAPGASSPPRSTRRRAWRPPSQQARCRGEGPGTAGATSDVGVAGDAGLDALKFAYVGDALEVVAGV